MTVGKMAYLEDITTRNRFGSVNLKKDLEGSSPPSVFIGRHEYPHVQAGPMLALERGDTSIMDSPESWIPSGKTQENIISYRLGLIRGKKKVRIDSVEDPLVEKIREISMSESSIESEINFNKRPRGASFSEERPAHGPSGKMDGFRIDNTKWNPHLEKVFHDTDLNANEAVKDLHRKGVPFSSIQKAFSTGTMGTGKRRKLVPTRWSITAADSMIGNGLLDEVRYFDPIDTFRLYEFRSLHNYYSVILTPTPWQYEWMEAFLKIRGNEEMLFSDHELLTGKREYSSVGGCFYSCRMAVLEALAGERKQAGAIILREAYRGYVPLGVFNVRENVRNAMKTSYTEFHDMKSILNHISSTLHLPLSRYESQSRILKEILRTRQSRLDDFNT